MLTTKEKVKEYLDITFSITKYDAVITTLIANVSAWVEKFTGRKFDQTTITEYFDGGDSEIFLSNFPVISITSVKNNAGTQQTPNWQSVSAEQYTGYFKEGRIKSNSFFPTGSRNIEVVYVSGYVTIPDDLELLGKSLVANLFNKRKAQGKSQERLGDALIAWNNELTQEQKDILSSYRKPRI